jgi:hypothetical protein
MRAASPRATVSSETNQQSCQAGILRDQNQVGLNVDSKFSPGSKLVLETKTNMEVNMLNSSQWLRVRVTDLRTGKSKANVKIPVGLADLGMRLAVRFAPASVEDLDMNQLIAAMKSSGEEKLVDVEDEEKGEHVEIFVE